MPLDFSCSKCQRTIRVPEGSEGRKTKCPKCEAIQRVPGQREGSQGVPGQDVERPGASQTPRQPTPPPSFDTAALSPIASQAPRGQIDDVRSAANPFTDEQPTNPYASPTQAVERNTSDAPSDSVDRAKLTLMGPAIATMIVAGISWLFNGGVIGIYVVIGFVSMTGEGPFRNESEAWYMFWAMIGALVLVTLVTGVVFAAMIRALKLRNYGFVLTGFILPAIPFTTSYCCVLALPFSIWGIIVLCDNSVKAAFRRP